MTQQDMEQQIRSLAGVLTSLMAMGLLSMAARSVARGILSPQKGPELLPQVHYCEKQCSHCDLMQVIPKEQLLHILLRGDRLETRWPQVVLPPARPGAPAPRPPTPGHHRVLIGEEEARHIHQLYATWRAEGYAPTAAMKLIADRMGHGLSTIWRVLHREIRPPLPRSVTPERLQEVVGLRRLGLTLEQIGRRLGFTKSYVIYLLHRAGEELLDMAAEAQRLNDRLYAVSRGLWPPVTISKLTAAALEAKAVADEVAVLLEIAPEEEELVKFQLGSIHGRALLAEEVLHNGVWCLRASEMAQLPLPPPPSVPGFLGRPMGVPRPVTVTPEMRRLLKVCAEEARRAARGIIQGWPEYQERVSEVLVEPIPQV